MKPIIGISCNVRLRDEGIAHELQDRYVQAVSHVGGIAVALPRLDPEEVGALVQFLDGVIISGGR
ncbi:MAG: gamma-glutamyl-gamma-aminobutyrate hydrolase family protein, partial [Candidatus Bathyarchaeia archaeon]